MTKKKNLIVAGPNSECIQRNGAGSCKCIQDYIGDPYVGCRPECVLSSDCPTHRACIKNKCVDPCPGVCGLNGTYNLSTEDSRSIFGTRSNDFLIVEQLNV